MRVTFKFNLSIHFYEFKQYDIMNTILDMKHTKVTYEMPNCYADFDGKFPFEGIELLKSLELTTVNVPLRFGGKGLGGNTGNRQVLEVLKEVGSYDLSLGRIYEGHINALLLIERFGDGNQKERYFEEAVNGKIFGVWNSEMPTEPLTFNDLNGVFELSGAKVFCSGASNIDRPIVTAEGEKGTRMVIIDMDELRLNEDYTYWRPMGMKSSVSCRFDFSGVNFDQKQILGGPYDYVNEPDFTSGAARFAAVQLGGAEAAIRATIYHLEKTNRTKAPEQLARLAKLATLQETGRLWLKHTGDELNKRYDAPSHSMFRANLFRTVVREICENILSICEMSVGLQGMMQPHPLERIHRDLSVYLKQPGPDRTLIACAESFLKYDR
ncbi:MAG TPA: acyl-CoA dehydrogenase [Pricia antarctica]|uniref:Acyl-CoA dehydrogenase n=2 Tax=root TaxID=1 RepID=A0A831QNF3_9FLAO|nr:acyl-CoA dehydrogenase [Pricia antarctica]